MTERASDVVEFESSPDDAAAFGFDNMLPEGDHRQNQTRFSADQLDF